MLARFIFIGILLASFSVGHAQKQVTALDKDTHLKMLKKGVLLIRLSDQGAKIKALQERGRTKEADELIEETKSLNELIVSTFNQYYNYSKVNFINPEDCKQIVKDKSKTVTDIISGESIDLSSSNVYFTDYGIGNPADSYERYNRKGFQIFALENGQIVNLGRDLFYAGVKQGFFVGPFDKSMAKTVVKLNKRLAVGSKYF